MNEGKIALQLLKRFWAGEITLEQFKEACKEWEKKVPKEPVDEFVEKIKDTFKGEVINEAHGFDDQRYEKTQDLP